MLLKTAPTWVVLALCLVVRVLFVEVGSTKIWPERPVQFTGDSHHWLVGAKSIGSGSTYTIDEDSTNVMARMGRLPGYPAFLALVRAVTGDSLWLQGIVASQMVLDTLSCWLVVLIVRHISNSRSSGILAGLVYAFYPFAIVWVVKVNSETYATFCFLACFWAAIRVPLQKNYSYVVVAVVGVIATFAREFLGVLMLYAGLVLVIRLVQSSASLRQIVVYGMVYSGTALVLYGIWPVRNYYIADKLVFVTAEGAAYPRYNDDFNAVRKFVYAFQGGIEPFEHELVQGTAPNPFPAWVFTTQARYEEATSIIAKLRECGSSFRYRKAELLNQSFDSTHHNCNDSISSAFTTYRKEFIAHHPIHYYWTVPMKNLSKSIFKQTLTRKTASSDGLALSILFYLRSALLLIGACAGIVYFRRNPALALLLVSAVFQFVLVCWFVRQVEMRYLLQAEVALLILLACGVGYIFKRPAHPGLPGKVAV